MLPLSFPYAPVDQLAIIRISPSTPAGAISIAPVLQLDYTRQQDGNVIYNTINIEGVPFEKYGFTVACDEQIAKSAEEAGICPAESNIVVTLCKRA